MFTTYRIEKQINTEKEATRILVKRYSVPIKPTQNSNYPTQKNFSEKKGEKNNEVSRHLQLYLTIHDNDIQGNI